MELKTKGRYAVMAMADLAGYSTVSPESGGAGETVSAGQGGQSKSVPLSAISARLQISAAYLEQIFSRLRQAGLVNSTRGRAGGYQLAKDMSDISVASILSAVEEGLTMVRCSAESSTGCIGDKRCQTHELWTALGLNINAFLANVSLKDLVDGIPAADICNAHSITECARIHAAKSPTCEGLYAAPDGAVVSSGSVQDASYIARAAIDHWTIK